MTQCQMIARHLEDYGSIEPAEAFSEYGIYRLSARIADLKARGYQIRTELKETQNRYGTKVRYAKYVLEK